MDTAEGLETELLGNTSKPRQGRPYTYPIELIIFGIIVKLALSLPYRQLEGLFKSTIRKLNAKIPSFRTFWYRFSKLSPKLKELFDGQAIDFDSLPDDFVIAIDSTELKLSNRGEWQSKKHKKKPRKGWIRIHVAVDTKTKQVLEVEITDEKVHDIQKGESLVGKVVKKAKDKGYDSHRFFDFLRGLGLIAGVLVRKGSKDRGEGPRDEVVRQIGRKGINRYEGRIGYGMRDVVESVFSIFKRWVGEHVMGRRWQNIEGEILLKAMDCELGFWCEGWLELVKVGGVRGGEG
jgi:hypothetical protein